MKSLRVLLNISLHKTLSPLERLVLEELMPFTGIAYEANYEVTPYFIDIAFPKHKQGLEIDGHKYHISDEQVARDARRTEYLENLGWHIERVPGWFCYRYPDLAALKVLRFIPEVQQHP